MQFQEMNSVCIEPAASQITMWLPEAAAWMPTRPRRPTTMRASIGTMPCNGLFAPSWSAHEVSRSSKVVTNGSSISSAHVIATRVMFIASRSCRVMPAP